MAGGARRWRWVCEADAAAGGLLGWAEARLGARWRHAAPSGEVCGELSGAGWAWGHGASAGDVRALRPGLEGLARHLGVEVALTAVTATGVAAAREAVEEGWAQLAGAASPWRPAVPSALLRRPPGLVLVEQLELWPSLWRGWAASGVPVVIQNGRLSAGSARRWGWAGGRAGLAPAAAVWAATEADAARLRGLGVVARLAPPTKLASAKPPRAEAVEALRQRHGLGAGRPCLVAGSTRGVEEVEAVLDGLGGRVLVVAPRHVEEVEAALAAARRRGLRAGRASSGEAGLEVIVVDAFGGLPAWYGLAAEVFVGGTVAPIGGHNPAEAWAAGAPVVVGEATWTIAPLLEAMAPLAGAWRRWSGSGAVWGPPGEPPPGLAARLAAEGEAAESALVEGLVRVWEQARFVSWGRAWYER